MLEIERELLYRCFTLEPLNFAAPFLCLQRAQEALPGDLGKGQALRLITALPLWSLMVIMATGLPFSNVEWQPYRYWIACSRSRAQRARWSVGYSRRNVCSFSRASSSVGSPRFRLSAMSELRCPVPARHQTNCTCCGPSPPCSLFLVPRSYPTTTFTSLPGT